MTNQMACEDALRRAGEPTLSGAVLAARWHVQTCPRCQQALNTLWGQVIAFREQMALERWLGIDLGESIVQQTGQMRSWLSRGTGKLLAVMGQPATLPLTPLPAVATLGAGAHPEQRLVFLQAQGQSADGSLRWALTVFTAAEAQEVCTADVLITHDASLDLSGVLVLLTWPTTQIQQYTDDLGVAQFTDIPRAAVSELTLVIVPPQAPTTTNAPQ